jgi:hypothetical protein
MKWFQFSLRRMMLLILFCCIGLAFGNAAFSGTLQETALHVPLRFAYSVLAAAAFGAAVGTVFRNIYNGFAIGVFAAFLFYLLGFVGLALRLR